jgi:hypothetical protein
LPVFPLDTGYDLRDKIDWEGGVIGALEWGLNAEDLPQQYRAEWRKITRLYQQLDERCTTFYSGLPGDDAE